MFSTLLVAQLAVAAPAVKSRDCFRPVALARMVRLDDAEPTYPRPCNAQGAYPIQVISKAGDELVFGVQTVITNLDTGTTQVFTTESGHAPLFLAKGNYQLLSEASRHGFPQEAEYQVVDAYTGDIVESFPRSHVAITNILIEAGQFLRIITLPSTRPYNSVFYRLGPRRVPVAHIFARPYPANDFDVQKFNGREQFSAVPIALAFWGKTMAAKDPALAAQISAVGVPSLRNGEVVKDAVLVLGARVIAQDLADTFIAHRSEQAEDYRGHFHVTFLVKRDAHGRLPASLLSMRRDDLAAAFEAHIIWMFQHNVHRPDEGGGYAGKTFMQDLQEGKEKMQQWPQVSYDSTQAFRKDVQELDDLMARQGQGADYVFSDGTKKPALALLKDSLRKLLLAIIRERQNDQTYDASTLSSLANAHNQSIAERGRELDLVYGLTLDRLRQMSPHDAAEFDKM